MKKTPNKELTIKLRFPSVELVEKLKKESFEKDKYITTLDFLTEIKQ